MKNILKKYHIVIIGIVSMIMVTCVENHVLPNFGTIEVISDPSGAEVYLNDSLRGNTPLKIEKLLSGSYTLTLRLAEFIDTTTSIILNEDESWSNDFVLIESNPKGKITLTSQPDGASVFLDGNNTGQTTPTTFLDLPRGIYNFTLKLNLYDQENFSIDLGKDEIVEQNTILNIASSSGRLLVSSIPSGALVFLDDVNTGNVTPFTFNPLSPGSYKLKLQLAEYNDTTFNVNVVGGSLTTSNTELKGLFNITGTVNPVNSGVISGTGGFVEGAIATLNAIPNVGYNFINWTEGGSIVSTDIEYSFTVSSDRDLVANFELKTYEISTSSNPLIASTISGPGEYQHGDEVSLTLTINPGYRFLNWTEGITEVSTLESYTFTATDNRDLVANFEEIGNLSVTSDPIGASIFLNNSDTDEVTPHIFSGLVAGPYNVTLKLDDFADTTVTTNVMVNQTTDLGEVFLRDITPQVEVEITYSVSPQNRITFFFDFNQDVRFDSLIVTTPEEQEFSFEKNQVIPDGLLSDIGFPRKIEGIWDFELIGNKSGGRQADFRLFETKTVE